MIEPEWFNVEYGVFSKALAKSIGVASGRELDLLFRTIASSKCMDWHHVSNGVLIMWRDTWDSIGNIGSHNTFHILPVSVVPPMIFATRKTQFDSMKSKPIVESDARIPNWFDQHTTRHNDESEVVFSHRIIRTITATLRAVRRAYMQPQQPIAQPSTP